MNEKPQINFVSAAREFTCDDWPLGGDKRGKCRFWIESNKRGERVLRETERFPGSGVMNKPKATTYAPLWAILTGDDGRTYPASLSDGMVYVMDSALKFNIESIHRSSQPERFELIAALIESA